jgi:hypothetical protein
VLGFEVFAASEEKKRKDIQINAPSKKISLTLRNLDVFGLLLTQNKGPEGFEENLQREDSNQGEDMVSKFIFSNEIL